MRAFILLILFTLPSLTWAKACVITSKSENLSVTLCQQNRNIPEQMFKDGFCQPQLKGQEVSVKHMDLCPKESYGVCRNAKVGGVAYTYDIHYYGVASDAVFLKAACETQHQGTWVTR